MSNGEYEIDKDTFRKMDVSDQNWILYTTFNKQREDCDDRFCKLENRKKVDTAVAGGGGFIGGITAVILKWFFFK